MFSVPPSIKLGVQDRKEKRIMTCPLEFLLGPRKGIIVGTVKIVIVTSCLLSILLLVSGKETWNSRANSGGI